MPAKRVIFVDIDGVMAESLARWLTLYNYDNNTNFKKEDCTEFDVRIKPGITLLPYFSRYDQVEAVPFAFKSVQTLSMKYRIVFATVGQGGSWLKTRLPDAEIAQLHDKSLLRGFALIDDRPENLDGFVGERFLLSQPWNRYRGLNDTTWPDITRYLMNL